MRTNASATISPKSSSYYSKVRPNDCDEKCEYTYRYISWAWLWFFTKDLSFFWKNQENHGVFFDFWQRYMVAKKKCCLQSAVFRCVLWKNEKNDLEPEIQVNFSFVNLSILIAFCENIPCPEKRGREQTAMKGTTHWQKTETWTTKCRGPPPQDCGFTKGFWKGGKLKKSPGISVSSTCGSIKWWSRTNL